MDHEKQNQLATFLERVEKIAFGLLADDPKITPIEALRRATNTVEGEMKE